MLRANRTRPSRGKPENYRHPGFCPSYGVGDPAAQRAHAVDGERGSLFGGAQPRQIIFYPRQVAAGQMMEQGDMGGNQVARRRKPALPLAFEEAL